MNKERPLMAINLSLVDIQRDLRKTARECNERGLIASAKWAAEALVSMDMNAMEATVTTSTPLANKKESIEPELSDREQDLCLLAKSYFDAKEFDRAAHVLADSSSPKATFIRLYSRYLAGDRSIDEDNTVLLGNEQSSTSTNDQIDNVFAELLEIFEQGAADAYLTYLLGVLLRRLGRQDQAFDVLIEAVNRVPYIWSAWQELASCIDTVERISKATARLPVHCMTQAFLVYVSLELHQTSEDISNHLNQLLTIFPNNANLKAKAALLSYDLRDFEEAEARFDQVLQQDPYRLDDMDVFSNVLYVMEKKSKLSYLAHNASTIDRYRPETCCMVGNYYSLRSEHEKAILYFKRALKMNRQYLSAWTLMGHEYIELKNTHAAIQAYRRAVDVNRKDYRAWYGLGQTYELLEMRTYALYYYQRAASLRPYDPRMWQALGQCYEYTERYEEAIKCFKRALVGADAEVQVEYKLAKLYEVLGDRDSAAYYHRQCVMHGSTKHQSDDQMNDEGVVMADEGINAANAEVVAKSSMFLALYEMDRKQYTAAERYLQEAETSHGVERDEARALLRDLQSRRSHGMI